MTRRWDSYLVIFIGVGMTATFCFLLLGPQKQDLSALRTSARTMRDQLARGAGNIAGRAQTEVDIGNLTKKVSNYSTRILPDADVGAFVEQVSAIAERLELHDRTIVPQESEQRGLIMVLPIRITFVSGFAESFAFLRDVEQLPRAVRVTELTVERLTDSKGEPVFEAGGALRTELTIQVFYEAT